MWPKSIAAFLWGIVLSTSLMLNLNHLKLFSVQANLLIGLILAFALWAGVMTYCYSQNTVKQASIGCLKVLIVSALINAGFMLL